MARRVHRPIRQHPSSESAVERFGSQPESLLPILQDIHACDGELTAKALGAVADRTQATDAQVYGLATFYSMLAPVPRDGRVIRVCDGPACSLRGAADLRGQLEQTAGESGCSIQRTSCLGLCDRAPAALVDKQACGPLPVDASTNGGANDVSRFASPSPVYAAPRDGELRVAMRRMEALDPESLESALENGAYQSLSLALTKKPAEIIEMVSASGLQGRGGAGFPTGRKWAFVAAAEGDRKYIVCNADESEPSTFKDRVLMEGDPHLLLEGILIAAYAVGAQQAVIYIRGEYEFAAQRLERAVEQAVASNWVGANIQGSEFSCQIELHRGAGAYICGEETALLESLEGRRGEPRIRPPYPTTNGLYGLPTVVNNVETLCKTPAIVANGGAWYRSMGTEQSPGTKLYSICGDVNSPGVIEAPFGVSLRQLIEQFAGGMRDGANFKMALTGGAAGTLVDQSALDDPLEFAISAQGASLGSGAMLILSDAVSAPQLLGWLLHFFEKESCGKCTPCREGTGLVREIIERVLADNASASDLALLRQTSKLLRETSLCGLGQSVAWPIDSALLRFPDEFVTNGGCNRK